MYDVHNRVSDESKQFARASVYELLFEKDRFHGQVNKLSINIFSISVDDILHSPHKLEIL